MSLLLNLKIHAFQVITRHCHVWYQIKAIMKYKGNIVIKHYYKLKVLLKCYSYNSMYSVEAAKVGYALTKSCIQLKNFIMFKQMWFKCNP